MNAKQPNPFMDFDFTKAMGDFKMPGVDVESMVSAQKRNIEAVTAANQVAYEGMQAVMRRQTEIMQQFMEEANGMMREMMGNGAPEEKVAKQADLTRAAFEKALANMKELAELMSKSSNEAMDVIAKRVSESIDEMKTAVKTQNGAKK